MKQKFFFALIAMISSQAPVQALEPQNPVTLCERFLEGPPREACEKEMKALNPDWYLATACNQIFDDKAFYECVKLGKTAAFSPIKLESCMGLELIDFDRLACVKSARTEIPEAFQKRMPASKTKPKKSKP